MKIEEVSTLKIHSISQEKFEREEAAGNLNPNEIYLTPAPDIDNEPIENSNNLITSGGVYNSIIPKEINNLDDAIETGEYFLTIDGIKNKVFVIKTEIETESGHQTIISQTIMSGSADGVYLRQGLCNNNEPIQWQENGIQRTLTSNDISDSSGKTGHVLTSDTDGNWYWNKPNYVPVPTEGDIGKVLSVIGADPYNGFSWKKLDSIDLPIIRDTSGLTELDNARTQGVYKYISDNNLECILLVANYYGNMPLGDSTVVGTATTQILIKPTINFNLTSDNLGRGLKGPGAFIRNGSGVDNAIEFAWDNDGNFVNIHDLPTAPTDNGYYVLSSSETSQWMNLMGEPLTQILTKVEELLNTKLENVPSLNTPNTFIGNQTINGDLHIQGNITQNGDSYITHAEHLYTSQDLIHLRDGANGEGGTGLGSDVAGLAALNYDGNGTTGRLVFDSSGTAYVGDENKEQPLATRDSVSELSNNTNIHSGSIAVWDIDTTNNSAKLTRGISIVILTQNDFDNLAIKDENTLYFIKEG